MDNRPTAASQHHSQTEAMTAAPAFAPSLSVTSFLSSAAGSKPGSSFTSPLRPTRARPSTASHTTTRRTAVPPPGTAPTRVTPRAAADFYETLGVSRGASDSDIKSAFRQKARKLHPDVNKAPDAKERFQEVSRAYEVLSDPEMRQRYDRFGEAGVGSSAASQGGASGFGDFQDFGLNDIFDTFFGGQQAGGQGGRGRRRAGPQPGDDLRLDVDISFDKAVFGAEHKIRFSHLETCGSCEGTGVKPGTRPRTCPSCNGSGSVTQVVQTPLGMFQQSSTCGTCRGTGEIVDDYCGACGGRGRNQVTKQLMITIPAGVDTGSRLRIRNEGDAGQKGGPPGDLYVMLRVKESPDFKRDGVNLYSKVQISYLDAILGRKISVKTVDGEEEMTVSAGTQPGAVVRIDKKGVPKLGNANVRGDLFVTVDVKIPTRLSSAEKSLVQELDELAGNSSKGNGKVSASSGSDGEKSGRKASKNRGEGFFNFGKK